MNLSLETLPAITIPVPYPKCLISRSRTPQAAKSAGASLRFLQRLGSEPVALNLIVESAFADAEEGGSLAAVAIDSA